MVLLDQQWIDSKASLSPSCHHSADIFGQRFMAYGALNRVQVYTIDPLLCTQSIKSAIGSDEDMVLAVALSQFDQKLAISFGRWVEIWTYNLGTDNPAIEHTWTHETTLNHDGRVHCLSWSNNHELLAAGLELTLWDYKLTDMHQSVDSILGNVSSNLSLAASSSSSSSEGNDRRSSASSMGNSLYQKIWKMSHSHVIEKVEFSPDGGFFASFSKGDRSLKIWYPMFSDLNERNKWNFLYLYHPRVVISFEWRTLPSQSKIPNIISHPQSSRLNQVISRPNVLLTTSGDNVCRIWCEMKPQSLPSSKDNGAASFPIHEFQMTAVIDPAEHPAVSGDSAIPSVRNTSPVVAFTPPSLSFVDVPSNGAATIAVCSVSPIRARPIVQHREFFPLHFLNANELYRAIQSREEQELTFLRRRKKNASAIASLAERRNKWLVDTFREYPDILFHVNKDGTIVFWGIQHLTSAPHRCPKVKVIMKTQRAVLPPDASAFLHGSISMWYNDSPSKKSAIYFPSELCILVHYPSTASGSTIKLFSMNVDDFFAPSSSVSLMTSISSDDDTACLRMVNSWCGHSSRIRKIVKKTAGSWEINMEKLGSSTTKQRRELVATIDFTNSVIIWLVESPKMGVNSTCGLTYFADLDFGSVRDSLVDYKEGSPVDPTWLPFGNFLVQHTGKTLLLWNVFGVVGFGNNQVGQENETEDSRGATITTCLDGYDPEFPLIFLHSYAYYDDNLEPSTTVAGALVKVALVVGVSAIQSMTFVWKLEFDQEDSFLSCSLLSKGPLFDQSPSYDLISIASTDDLTTILSTWIWGELKPQDRKCLELAHWFVTFGSDHMFRFWRMDFGNESKWNELTSFKFFDDDGDHLMSASFDPRDVTMIKTDSFGKMLTVEKCSAISYRLSIWGNAATGLEMSREWSTVLVENIQDADWYFSSDGQHMLSVCTTGRIFVYCQQRVTSITESKSIWTCISDIIAPIQSEELVSVAWLSNGSIMSVAGKNIRVYEKWMRKYTDDGMDFNPPANIFSVASKLNGRLPDHHPNLLIQYLAWGQHDIVKHLLLLLYRFVKLAVQTNGSFTDVPIPLLKLLNDSEGGEVSGNNQENYESLFSVEGDENGGEANMKEFNDHHAKYLCENLGAVQLPNIDGEDKRMLLAMIDTVAMIDKHKRSLDANGVRYLLSMKMYMCMSQSSPNKSVKDLETRDAAWAFYSDSQDTLMDVCNNMFENKLNWTTARAMGLGLWLRNPDSLKRTVESMARNQYMNSERDPVQCSLFYMALRKKTVLLGLWKLANGHPEQSAMMRFMANDFSDDRWKKAALKNAYALLGKQRFEYAVAFFLLGEKLRDAVNVCLKQLNDYQLALVLCRLQEGEDSPLMEEILRTNLIPLAFETGDRWLLSISYSLLKRKSDALLSALIPFNRFPEYMGTKAVRGTDPALVILYRHLRETYKKRRIDVPEVSIDIECEFMYRSANAYERLGCPALALRIIQKSLLETTDIYDLASEPVMEEETRSSPPAPALGVNAITAFDWGEPVSSQKPLADTSPSVIDWSQPVSSQMAPTLSSSSYDWGGPVSSQPQTTNNNTTSSGFDWSEPVSQKPTTNTASAFDLVEPVSTSNGNTAIDWGELVSTIKMDDDYEAVKSSLGGALEDEPSLTVESDDNDLRNNIANIPESPRRPSKKIVVNAKSLRRFQIQKKHIFLYKWQLFMRIVQAIFNSASVASRHAEMLKYDPSLGSYFDDLKQGIMILSNQVNMPEKLVNRLLDIRCREMDSIIAHVELLPIYGSPVSTSASFLSSFLIDVSNTLARITFSQNLDVNVSNEDLSFLSTLARRVLWALVRWQEKYAGFDSNLSDVAPMASATSFTILTLTLLIRKQYESLWWLIALSDRFFEILSNDKRASDLLTIIKEIIQERGPSAETAADENGHVEYDFEDTKFVSSSPGLKASSEALLSAICMMHVGLGFEAYLTTIRKTGKYVKDVTNVFLCDHLMKSISSVIFDLQVKLEQQWKDYPVGCLDDVPNYLGEVSLKKLWELFKKDGSINQMVDLSLPTTIAPTIEPINSDEGKPPVDEVIKSEVIYRNHDFVGSFAVNPLDHNCIALSTAKGVIEVDIVNAMRFFERKGSFNEYKAFDDLVMKKSSSHLSIPDEGKHPRSFSHSASYDTMPKPDESNNGISKLKKLGISSINVESGLKLKRSIPPGACLEAHPNLNYYLAAFNNSTNNDSIANLYQFGQSKELVTYETGSPSKLIKCHFDSFGARFGACDSKGDLFLWKFDASLRSLQPFKTIHCHSSVCNDFTFVNSSSILATAGLSMNFNNVCLWDTLLPPAKSKVKSFSVNETGSHSIAFSPFHNLIFSGGKKGDIAVIDIRQKSCLVSFSGHNKTVKSLCIDNDSGTLLSGCVDGSLKIWDIRLIIDQIPAASASSSFQANFTSKNLVAEESLVGHSISQISNTGDGVLVYSDVDVIRKARIIH